MAMAKGYSKNTFPTSAYEYDVGQTGQLCHDQMSVPAELAASRESWSKEVGRPKVPASGVAARRSPSASGKSVLGTKPSSGHFPGSSVCGSGRELVQIASRAYRVSIPRSPLGKLPFGGAISIKISGQPERFSPSFHLGQPLS